MSTTIKRKKGDCNGCGRNVWIYAKGYGECCYWNVRNAEKPKVLKPRSPIPKVSTRRKIENRQYTIERLRFLAQPENQRCPITGEQTTEIHHKKGRIGNLLNDTRYWLAVSRKGHQKIEENPEWAKEQGYSENRLQ